METARPREQGQTKTTTNREERQHALVTPLSIIKGSLETLRTHGSSLDETRRTELVERALAGVSDLSAHLENGGRPAGAPPPPPPRPLETGRLELVGTSISRGPDVFEAAVKLRATSTELVGRAQGRTHASGERRVVAMAVLDALRGSLRQAPAISGIEVVEMGTHSVVLVALDLGHRFVTGTASVTLDIHDAVTRATLDALNRQV